MSHHRHQQEAQRQQVMPPTYRSTFDEQQQQQQQQFSSSSMAEMQQQTCGFCSYCGNQVEVCRCRGTNDNNNQIARTNETSQQQHHFSSVQRQQTGHDCGEIVTQFLPRNEYMNNKTDIQEFTTSHQEIEFVNNNQQPQQMISTTTTKSEYSMPFSSFQIQNQSIAQQQQQQEHFNLGNDSTSLLLESSNHDFNNNQQQQHHNQYNDCQQLFMEQSSGCLNDHNNNNTLVSYHESFGEQVTNYADQHDQGAMNDQHLMINNDSSGAHQEAASSHHPSPSSSSRSPATAAELTSTQTTIAYNSLISESSSSSFTSLNEINCNDLYRFQLTTSEEELGELTQLHRIDMFEMKPGHHETSLGRPLSFNGDSSNSGGSSDTNCIKQRGNNTTTGRNQRIRRGRPKKLAKRFKNKMNGKLWEFIRDLLLDEQTNPTFIRWERQEDGVFKFVQSDKVAKMWGERKQNPKMTYEKLSRAMRYYYKSKVLLPVFGRRLVYKFGPNATGWMQAQ